MRAGLSVSKDSGWVSSLARRYTNAVNSTDNPDAILVESLTQLQFAQAMLDRSELDQRHAAATQQIAVLGPTQSGKSSMVNVLLDATAASVSALAGFTVHAQGYTHNLQDNDISLVESMMEPLERVPAQTLDAKNFNSYVLETTQCAGQNLVGNTIVWDTPDFDSITADSYELCVLKVAALADAIVLIVSKDKYADQRVWDVLELIQASGKPLLLLVNKVDELDISLVDNAITKRWATHFGSTAPPRLMLPFIQSDHSHKSTPDKKSSDRAHKLPLSVERQEALSRAIEVLLSSNDRHSLSTRAHDFIRANETRWVEPLMIEMNSLQRWNELVDEAIIDAEAYYVDHYLNNNDKYETFNRALAELLSLLEIPGIAPTLAHTRKLITWPARKVLGLGRQALGKYNDNLVNADGKEIDQEQLALKHAFERTTAHIQGALLESTGEPLWDALAKQFRGQLPSIQMEYEQISNTAIEAFKPEIDAAAMSLYEELKTQPALLNTLRAARASADAAGVALAVKSGGLAPTDLILAPAMLSVTTLLTESALGRYLDSVKHKLKKRQQAHIRDNVLHKALQQRLKLLADQLDQPELLGGTLEPELLTKLDAYR